MLSKTKLFFLNTISSFCSFNKSEGKHTSFKKKNGVELKNHHSKWIRKLCQIFPKYSFCLFWRIKEKKCIYMILIWPLFHIWKIHVYEACMCYARHPTENFGSIYLLTNLKRWTIFSSDLSHRGTQDTQSYAATGASWELKRSRIN